MFEGTLSPVSNQEDWNLVFEIDDAETLEPIDLSGAAIVLEIRDPRTRGIVLSASTGNGKIAILDTGVFQAVFTRSEMQTLRAQSYDVGCVLTINDSARQYLIGTVPVLDGVVTQ